MNLVLFCVMILLVNLMCVEWNCFLVGKRWLLCELKKSVLDIDEVMLLWNRLLIWCVLCVV